jgi:hypothetical protein
MLAQYVTVKFSTFCSAGDTHNLRDHYLILVSDGEMVHKPVSNGNVKVRKPECWIMQIKPDYLNSCF